MLRRRSRGDVFLLAWLVLLGIILWAPTPADNLRRRFFDGIYLPLVVMAAEGMYAVVVPRLKERGRRLVPFAYVAFAAVGSIFLLIAPLLVVNNSAYSIPTGEYQALQWLSPRPAGVVLTSDRLGLLVPGYTADTVYVGQYSETFNWAAKTREADDLLHGRADLAAFVGGAPRPLRDLAGGRHLNTTARLPGSSCVHSPGSDGVPALLSGSPSPLCGEGRVGPNGGRPTPAMQDRAG